jgi:protoheme IX farnesyltransferase
MVVAKGGWPSTWLIVLTLVGGTLAAGGANAINMVFDRDIDAVMKRTQNRPLVTGIMTPRAALIFALAIEVLAFVQLWLTVNLLSAILAVSATLFYVFIYTMWLKRRSTQNIVIGGAAGAVPVLVGWSAVTNSLAWPPVILFLIIFIWTPPHFWALAIRYRDDYEAVDVPMLPVVASMERTTLEMMIYSLLMAAATILFGASAHLGAVYAVVALLLNVAFIWLSISLYLKARRGEEIGNAEAMRLFHYSITYLTLLFVAMAADVLIRNLIHSH